MAKISSKPNRSLKQRIEDSLAARAKSMNAPVPSVGISSVDFVSQAEIVSVLNLRAQIDILHERLLAAQGNILEKLEDGSDEELGFYSCMIEHLQLKIWERDTQIVL